MSGNATWQALQEAMALALQTADMRHRRRRLRPMTREAGGRVSLGDGRMLIDFSSNDYLGLSLHPQVMSRAAEFADRYGAGVGASRLVTGTSPQSLDAEAKLAAFKGSEAAILFASGYQANASVLPTLIGLLPNPVKVFADRLNHASLHAGLAQAGARQIRFRHNDLDHLEQLLAAPQHQGAARLIVTEAVFSMDGDRADLTGLLALAQRHGAALYIDEAHSTGVLGPQGRGLCAELPADAPVVVMGTLGKALGGFGAYIAGSRALVDLLVQTCGGLIYSTAPPPAVFGALDAALDLIPGMDEDRARLLAGAERVRGAAAERGLSTFGSSTQIVPVGLASEDAALKAMAAFEARGLLAIAIRPPTVPEGASRIRLALSAVHSEGDIEALAQAIGALG
jgi:8-amino-7-oxononanoate synthase